MRGTYRQYGHLGHHGRYGHLDHSERYGHLDHPGRYGHLDHLERYGHLDHPGMYRYVDHCEKFSAMKQVQWWFGGTGKLMSHNWCWVNTTHNVVKGVLAALQYSCSFCGIESTWPFVAVYN